MPNEIVWAKADGYTEEVGEYIIDQVENGCNLVDVAEYLGIQPSTISMWAARGKMLGEATFKDKLNSAKEVRAHTMAESMLRESARLPDEVREMVNDGKSHKIANAYVNAKTRHFSTTQWVLERMLPEVYGDKVTHQGKIEHGLEVRIVNFADVIDGEVINDQIRDDSGREPE